jgi:hypothetical protein
MRFDRDDVKGTDQRFLISNHITAQSSPDSVGWAKALLRRAHQNLTALLALLIPAVGTARRAPLPTRRIGFLEAMI